jgi:glutathione S-transferase
VGNCRAALVFEVTSTSEAGPTRDLGRVWRITANSFRAVDGLSRQMVAIAARDVRWKVAAEVRDTRVCIFAVVLGIYASFSRSKMRQMMEDSHAHKCDESLVRENTSAFAPVSRSQHGEITIMSLIVYERIGHEGCRPSCYSWCTRYALAHKALDVEYRPMRHADVETIQNLSGQTFLPVLLDGEVVLHDSWKIAVYLEDRFPDQPSLFGGPTGRAVTRLLNHWADTTLHPPLWMLALPYMPQYLCPEDRNYFIRSREKQYGMTLEQVCSERAHWQSEVETVCLPLERLLGEQEFIGGQLPTYADYIVVSHFMPVHLCYPEDVVRPDSAIALWRSRMFDLFDGLARTLGGIRINPGASRSPRSV